MPVGSKREKYLYISAGHLTEWSIPQATGSDTSALVIDFVKDDIMYTLGPLQAKRLLNTRCFTSRKLQDLMEKPGIKWKIVMEYALCLMFRPKA